MSTARHHAEWLSLVEVSGPFLSMPVLMRIFPQGLDPREPEKARELRLAYEEWLEKLAPHEPTSQYRHNLTGEDNGDAHIKRQVMGREVVVAITEGRLDFGPWEQIFYGEFDGRRRKRVLVKIIGE